MWLARIIDHFCWRTDDVIVSPLNMTHSFRRCLCTVNIDDNESAFDLGEVHRFSDLEEDPALDKTVCRKLRHQCRHECAMSADINRRLPSGSQLGFSLCVQHRQVTDHNGVGFSSYATLEGCHQHVPIAPTVGEQKLCCGHTGIRMKSEYTSQLKTYYVFGWNPDCNAETFMIH